VVCRLVYNNSVKGEICIPPEGKLSLMTDMMPAGG